MGLKHYPKGSKVWDQAPNINLSPSEIQRMYERGYSGVYFDPEAYEEFKELSVRTGGYLNVEDAASRYGWYGNFAGQLVIPFVHIIELCPGAIPGPSQLSGSCVAHAGKNAVLGTMVCEVVSGLPDEVTGAPETLPEVSSTAMKNGYLAIEPAYWYRGHGGEGWFCASHGSVSMKNSGAMLRQNYPEIGVDLTVYTRANTHKWGRTSPPESVGKHLRNNLIRSVAKVNSFEGIRDSLGNGKFINSCGMEGFNSVRDTQGVSRRQGQWAHCCHPSSMVYGESFKRIDEVCVGDKVYGHDGKLHRVKEVHARPNADKYITIKCNGSEEIKITTEHPLLVYRRVFKGDTFIKDSVADSDLPDYRYHYKNYKAAWIKAKDVTKEDLLVSPKIEIDSEPIIPEINSDRDFNFKPSKDLAWLLGMYIGDGSSVKSHKIVLTLGKNKDYSRAKKVLESLGINVTLKESENHVRLIAYSSVLANHFREWFGTSSPTKVIPDWLMTWNKEALIEGLIGSDGCRYKNVVILSTTSRVLAFQYYSILHSLGIKAVIGETKGSWTGYSKEGYNCKDGYTINFRENQKSSSLKVHENMFLRTIRKIEEEECEDLVYNLEVEDVNSYIINGIAVHNSMAYIAADDRPEIVRKYGSPLVLIQNSWGPGWNSGPRDIFDSAKYVPAAKKDLWIRLGIVSSTTGNILIPQGSFWAKWSDISRRDSYVYAGVHGWKASPITTWGTELIG